MFGEIVGDNDSLIPGFSDAWISVGAVPTAWGTPTGTGSGWWHFSSQHTGIVQFALGDGSVKGTGLGGKIITAMASGLRSKVEYDGEHRGVRARLAFDL